MPRSCVDEGRAVEFAVGGWNAALDPVVPIQASLDNDIRVPTDDFRLLIVGLRKTTALAQHVQQDQRNMRLRFPVPTAMPASWPLDSNRQHCNRERGPRSADRRHYRVFQCRVSDGQRSDKRNAATPARDRDGMDTAPSCEGELAAARPAVARAWCARVVT
jgi:hypothetical protein